MSGGVVSEFHHREEGQPFFRLIQGEQPQVGFQFLIHSFGFSISLRMVGSGKSDVILE